jgi:hypothetical protein
MEFWNDEKNPANNNAYKTNLLQRVCSNSSRIIFSSRGIEAQLRSLLHFIATKRKAAIDQLRLCNAYGKVSPPTGLTIVCYQRLSPTEAAI